MHLTRLKDVPITQLFCVDVALVLEKTKHHQTYQFHPRQMQVKAAQDSCLSWCILHLPFTVQRKKAILIGTLKFCRRLITSLVLSCQETDDCRLPNITCWEGKKWCSCIGRNYKLAVSYAFGNSLVVHSRVLIAPKMVK